jgi:hypothetical protein
MKVYQKIAGNTLVVPALRADKQSNGLRIPIGTTVYRWETLTKLQVVFGFLRNDLDENRVFCDGFELAAPVDVTWFYIEESRPTFATDWRLVLSCDDSTVGRQDVPNAQTGNYQLAATDSGKTIWMDSALAQQLTIPSDATVDFPINGVAIVVQMGVGAVTVLASAGVTFNGVVTGSGSLANQYAAATLIKKSANTWVAIRGGIGVVS